MHDNFHFRLMHMPESTINAKGQTTIPASVRHTVGAVAGTRLVWHVKPDGRLFVRAKTKSMRDLKAMLTPPDGTQLSVEHLSG